MSYLPALLLALAVWTFLLLPEQGIAEIKIQSGVFYVLLFFSLLFLKLTDRLKPFFTLVWVLIAYLTVSHINTGYGNNIKFSGAFDLLLILMPINILALEFVQGNKLLQKRSFYTLCLILGQGMIIEKFFCDNVMFSFPALFYFGLGVWILTLFVLLCRSVSTGGIESVFTVYGLISIFLGLCCYSQNRAFSFYFMAAVVILAVGIFGDYIYSYFRDTKTGTFSRHAYRRHSLNSFPLKYSLGVVCIDNYDKLVKAFGEEKVNKLTILLVNLINSLQPNALLYRYEDDEFILIFPNEDKKKCYESMEIIRRTIAGSTFVLSKDVKLKITISAGISEKKRSDADAEVVLTRTREAVQRAYKFTQNMTSKA